MYLLSHYTMCFILLHVDQCNKGRVFPRICVHVLFLKTNCGKAFIPELWAVLTKVGTNVITILKIMLLTKLFLANWFLCCNFLGLEYCSDCSFLVSKLSFQAKKLLWRDCTLYFIVNFLNCYHCNDGWVFPLIYVDLFVFID